MKGLEIKIKARNDARIQAASNYEKGGVNFLENNVNFLKIFFYVYINIEDEDFEYVN